MSTSELIIQRKYKSSFSGSLKITCLYYSINVILSCQLSTYICDQYRSYNELKLSFHLFKLFIEVKVYVEYW